MRKFVSQIKYSFENEYGSFLNRLLIHLLIKDIEDKNVTYLFLLPFWNFKLK